MPVAHVIYSQVDCKLLNRTFVSRGGLFVRPNGLDSHNQNDDIWVEQLNGDSTPGLRDSNGFFL